MARRKNRRGRRRALQTLGETNTSAPPMRERVERLPPSIYQTIYDYTFSMSPFRCDLNAAVGILGPDETFTFGTCAPDKHLGHVDRSSRKLYFASCMENTEWMAPCAETCMRWLRLIRPKSRSLLGEVCYLLSPWDPSAAAPCGCERHGNHGHHFRNQLLKCLGVDVAEAVHPLDYEAWLDIIYHDHGYEARLFHGSNHFDDGRDPSEVRLDVEEAFATQSGGEDKSPDNGGGHNFSSSEASHEMQSEDDSKDRADRDAEQSWNGFSESE